MEAPAQSRRRLLVDLCCERGLLGIVLLIVLWGPLAFGGVPAPAFVVIQGLTVVALALWAVRIWMQRPFRLFWPPVCWAVFLFLLYALVRCRLVPIEYAGREELVHVLVYASLFFIVINNFQRRNSATIIAVCLIALGLLLSLDAIFQFATKYPRIWGIARRAQFLDRGVGTYINPDHLAGLLGMIVPLAISYTLMSRFTSAFKVLCAYASLVMLAGIGVTLSRGGILATGAMLAVFFLVLLFQRGCWLPALGVIAGVVALCFAFGVETDSVQKRFNLMTVGNPLRDSRVSYWSAAIHIFEDHPLWGGGPGHYDWEYARYRAPMENARPVYAHNDYLNTLSDWGAAGLAIIAATLVLLCAGAWKTWPALNPPESGLKRPPKTNKAAFLMGASMGLVYMLFHSAVDFNMHIPANAIIAVLFMALISLHWRFASEAFWKNPRQIGKVLLTLALIPAMVWLAVQGVIQARQSYWLHRADDESAPGDVRAACLKKAWEAEPSDYVTSYNLGEYYRLASFQGNPGYEKEAREAMPWYARSMAANPLDAFVPARYGMCLDWLGETVPAARYFDRAVKLDPKSNRVAYYMGRHCMESGDYPAAARWFQRSIDLHWTELAGVALQEARERMSDPRGLYKK